MNCLKTKVAAAAALTACACFAGDNLNSWFESATVKVRQDATPRNMATWTIKAARNEFEPFQYVLRAVRNYSNVDVSITDFSGSNGTISKDNVTIFLVKYLNVQNISSQDGERGEWPDALCPRVDAYYHEKRNFFPFDLPAGRIQPIWFDVFVPQTASAGDYTATVRVTANGGVIAEADVQLHVWNFSLPATSSLASRFRSNMDRLYPGHYGNVWNRGTNPWDTIVTLQRTYIRAGLRHRITMLPVPLIFRDWNGSNYGSIRSEPFLECIEGFCGDGDPQVEYGNAKMTSLIFRFDDMYHDYVNCGSGNTSPPWGLLNETRKRAQAMSQMLSAKQKEMLAILPLDEPGAGEVGCGHRNPDLDFNSAKEMAKIIHEEGLRTIITRHRLPELLNTTLNPPQNSYFDIWAVTFTRIDGRHWDGSHTYTRPEYDADIENGAQLWWYNSCMSHGCGTVGSSNHEGYPQYGVEYPAMYTRMFPWLAFKNRIQGEMYWAATFSYAEDPWQSLWMSSYGGYGDGTFFYPGVPNTGEAGLPAGGRGANTPSIGGTHHIPIESIRLKLIREGYEDFEYLHLLDKLGGGEFAQNKVAELANTTYDFSRDPEELYAVRNELGETLDYLLSPTHARADESVRVGAVPTGAFRVKADKGGVFFHYSSTREQ
ncbi:MAG: DUF4091 domain-containing protein, partial [Chitinivibrionales bacterium]|nr:DUF4091 domain-containing protein [Chitinivibrionales bacterium]MBD3357895.1 DUF4091 domain-containing protein [Chitinivibrionales bacterium]